MTRDDGVGPKQGYLDRVIRDGMKMERGKVFIASVLHDDWCRRPDGDRCTCDPDIVYEEVEER